MKTTNTAMNATMSLTADAVTVRKSGRIILDGVSASCAAGRVTMILGPNGAGKSTLLRVMAGLEAPAAGHVRWGANDLSAVTLTQRAAAMAYVPASPHVPFAYAVEDVVLMGRFARHHGHPGPADHAAAARAMEAMALMDLRHAPITHLSSGEKQRVHIARALAAETPLMLLDEPTAHLDLAQAFRVLAALADRACAGATVILTHHDLHSVEGHADGVVVLAKGALVKHGSPAEAFTPRVMAEAFGLGMTGEAGARVFTLNDAPRT